MTERVNVPLEIKLVDGAPVCPFCGSPLERDHEGADLVCPPCGLMLWGPGTRKLRLA